MLAYNNFGGRYDFEELKEKYEETRNVDSHKCDYGNCGSCARCLNVHDIKDNYYSFCRDHKKAVV